jgi:hypothetical protein
LTIQYRFDLPDFKLSLAILSSSASQRTSMGVPSVDVDYLEMARL